MNENRLSPPISEALASGATLIVGNAQRQAAVRSAWSAAQRDRGRTLWSTPRVLTFAQFAEARLDAQWSAANVPDQLLPAGAEWALLRDLRREAGGSGEARALLGAVRTLRDWQIPRTRAALGGSPEGSLLLEALEALGRLAAELGRKPLADWLGALDPVSGGLWHAGLAHPPPLHRAALQRLGSRAVPVAAATTPVAIATADDDEHELALIAAWCRQHLEDDPDRRLLIVDAKLRQRRRQYERVLSQALSPSEWLSHEARAFSTFFSIEGGQPLTDFPLIAHALLTMRLLTSSLRVDEVLLWLRMPFLDQPGDVFAGAAIESLIREGHKLEFSAAALAAQLERRTTDSARALAARLRQATALLGNDSRPAHEWAARLLAALRAVGWHGSRPLRSDEKQTVDRWNSLLDEYSALGNWLPRAAAAEAVATLTDLARERSFDPASVAAPVTLSDSHDDPLVHYDAIWVAGLDAAQWPPPARPDVFIPLRLQVAAGIPAASAAGQSARARASLHAWRAATSSLVCSWARLDGDAHRTPSPLLARAEPRNDYSPPRPQGLAPLAALLHAPQLEQIDDSRGVRVNTAYIVPGGVTPLRLQAECGFHAYGEMRLSAARLEEPRPGIDPRDRGKLLHKALELVWSKLDAHFLTLAGSDALSRGPAIADSVRAAITHVFHGHVPPELQPAVEREARRLERLIEALFQEEARRAQRATFHVECLEALRQVTIAGGTFEVRIDRIDKLQGGGYAILDYKTGEPRPLRWSAEAVRDPQLLAYLLAERGRDVQALANISLTRGRARFVGKAARTGLLPDVIGLNASKVPAEQIDAAWHADLDAWVAALSDVARRYLDGEAPVEPAPDVCRNCHLTVLCRRVELADQLEGVEPGDE
ncbi:MAG TPA: PD-(D/E)XK nuclease family protein [Steroidobacteraceae bacterium]|nr:PD-(D/E)XK nuclease family protein [Steroidobacteraceae bacterium]